MKEQLSLKSSSALHRQRRPGFETCFYDILRVGLAEVVNVCLMGAMGAGALKAYNKAIEIRRSAAAKANGGAAPVTLSARLLNNAAVLHLRAGEAEEALRLMGQAVSAAASGGLGDMSAVAQVGA